MAVASHVNIERLLASTADDFDDRNATMVDGRAVQHTMLFIEPHLVQLHPHAVWEAADLGRSEHFGSIAVGGFSPWKRARAALGLGERGVFHHLEGVIPVEILEAPDGRVRPGSTAALRAFEDALGILSEFGLAYFVELAVGAVVFTKDPIDAPHTVVLDFQPDPLPVAQRLLAGAARELIWQWIEAEVALNDTPGRSPQKFGELIDLFSASVLCEFRRRADSILDDATRRLQKTSRDKLAERAGGMLAWLDTFTTTPLTQELVSCWYPGWRRSLFIYNSPFDPMNALKPNAQ